MKSTFAAARINLATNKLSAFITIGVVLLVTISNSISAFYSGGDNSELSLGNYFYLYILMIPFFIVLSNYKKFINLNAGKRAYYAGSILTYAVAALLISLCNTLFYTIIEKLLPLYSPIPMSNLMEMTGWMSNGVFIAFLQQAAFVFLVGIALHVLLSLQSYWVGWVVDFIIVAVISVFTPIEPLRNALASFFGLIMFNSNYILHIAVCLGLSAVICILGVLPLKRRTA